MKATKVGAAIDAAVKTILTKELDRALDREPGLAKRPVPARTRALEPPRFVLRRAPLKSPAPVFSGSREVPTGRGIISGYAATHSLCRNRRAISAIGLVRAWEAAGAGLPIWCEHDARSVVGKITRGWLDDRGLFVVGELDMASEAGQKAWDLYQARVFTGFSVGLRDVHSVEVAGYDLCQSFAIREISLARDPSDWGTTFSAPMPEGPYHRRIHDRARGVRFRHLWITEGREGERPARRLYTRYGLDERGRQRPLEMLMPAAEWPEEVARFQRAEPRTKFYRAGDTTGPTLTVG